MNTSSPQFWQKTWINSISIEANILLGNLFKHFLNILSSRVRKNSKRKSAFEEDNFKESNIEINKVSASDSVSISKIFQYKSWTRKDLHLEGKASKSLKI